MKIIINNQENLIVINKSKFIGIIKKVYSNDDILVTLKEVKEKYLNATHICYAYILNNEKKYSDDKEPSGTAGMPILNVLEKNNLNYVIAIVIRYFGGIKLGSSGLVRAYSNTISDLINNNIKEQEEGYIISINEDYSNIQEILYLLGDSPIIKKDYSERIKIETLVNKNTLNKLKKYHINIIKNIIM